MNYVPLIQKVVASLLASGAQSATKFVSAKEIVRVTRRLYKGRIDKRGPLEMMLTIGRPNYLERDFIKLCKKAGEPFPVKKIQLKPVPVRRSK